MLTRSVLDTAHVAFISMDADGLILEWNREAERTFGHPREAVVGRELAVTIIPERDRGRTERRSSPRRLR